ncbi:uncharacterized protein LOC120683367 [Panicum virgatum]|uniref:Uncharacterized protein n=1 Tax=Panicum virgatum TaxID=38727 RepID=A0A8T0QCH9_PANVG|nr:uncharacterized protein LOC120683367 [Panicum virgatum]KAG2568536.1 hypothetical protein PVAP13_7NG323400 [Panicum virgatum]
MDLKEGRQASGGRAGGPPSRLACNMGPPRRVSFAVDGPPQPQTATCCTALQRGFAPDSRVQPRYAPVRTPASAALLQVGEDDDRQPQSAKDGGGGGGGEEMVAVAAAAVRKWKYAVEDADVAQLAETPRLRRSGGVRRDWSFENLHAGKNAAA